MQFFYKPCANKAIRLKFPARFSICLLALVACWPAFAAEPDASRYSSEVHEDEPVCFFLFADGEAKDGTAFRNSSRAKQPGPDGVVSMNSKAIQLVAGPSGVGGRAATFGGANLVEIPSHAVFDAKEIAVEFWFRSTQPFDQKYWPASATFLSKATSGPGSSDWTILGGSLTAGANEGRVLVGVGPKGREDVVLASGTGLNDGRFHHVVWTRTATGKSVLSVDGMTCATAQDSGQTISNARAIQVGGENREPGTFLNGEIGAIAIYSHVLPEERVQAHFAAGSFDLRLPPPTKRPVDFARDIKPLFQQYCFECHGPGKDNGGLSLATRALALDGGDNGRVIVPGKSVLSPLVRWVAALDKDRVMPPDGDRLSAEQIGIIRAWIDQGAVWPESADEVDPRVAKAGNHWSFKPLRRPSLPELQDAWVRSPIDAFILTKLNEAGLSPAPPATKEALLRRVSFDLTGLPPAPEEIAAFVSDAGAEAFAKVVDRMLASPAYGERWARHWLDVVRYADSGGYETDIFYEQAWRYRNYVIRSFNDDKAYDRFLMEQVAGDELWPEQSDAMQDAVAVWTLGEWQNALDAYPDVLEYVRRTDQVSTLSEAVLGLTSGCANCHNHKYDPITQRDYFGLEAIFAASETWNRNTGAKSWGKGERTAYRALRHAEQPTPIHLLRRGELTKPTTRIAPALPAFLPGGGALPSGPDENKQRRSHLARWLVSPQNPLTARVIANRIWQWHFGQAVASTPNDLGTQGSPPSHPELLDWLASELVSNGWSMKKLHRLIVLSSTYRQSAVRDAKAGAADPQNRLLAGFPRRRLEAEAVWDHLHAAAGTLDRKSFGAPFVPMLSPEELRGVYDIEGKPENKWPVTVDQTRRAIYILNRRSFRFPFFEAFDPPNTAVSCPVRQTTTVPTQALTLLNNRIVGEQARAMAEHLTREAGNDVEELVRLAWLRSYSRPVSEVELKLALNFLAVAEDAKTKAGKPDARRAALVEFCMGLMNTTEFIYTN